MKPVSGPYLVSYTRAIFAGSSRRDRGERRLEVRLRVRASAELLVKLFVAEVSQLEFSLQAVVEEHAADVAWVDPRHGGHLFDHPADIEVDEDFSKIEIEKLGHGSEEAKRGSGTVARTSGHRRKASRALRATVLDPFLNHAA